MRTVDRLEMSTSIMTMGIDSIGALDDYRASVKHWADMVDAGLITYEEAVQIIRRLA